MFTRLIRTAHTSYPDELGLYLEYLERHIQLDGEEHGIATLHMLNEVCHNSPEAWQQAKVSAQNALKARIRLWDGAHKAMTSPQEVGSKSSSIWTKLAGNNS